MFLQRKVYDCLIIIYLCKLVYIKNLESISKIYQGMLHYFFFVFFFTDTRLVCVCGRKYCNQNLLKFHHKWECGRKIRCHNLLCDKLFDTISTLRNHMSCVHNCYLDRSFYESIQYADESDLWLNKWNSFR